MTAEIIEGTVSESRALAVSEITMVPHERGHGGVAILLTVAAIVAAAIGFRAAMVSGSASDSWQSALRTEVKRSAAAMEDVRYLYQSELPVAIQIVEARILQAQLLDAAQGVSGATKQTLLLEASVQAQMITALSPSSDLAAKTDYALPSGGLDLGKRLADLRAQHPELLALDPDGLQASGDKLAHKAEVMTLALLPASVAAFLGVLAQAFKRRRILFLWLGALALAGGVAMALAVEVLA
jgi:hypothetical protein